MRASVSAIDNKGRSMQEVQSDWEKADSAHLNTYRGVMKISAYCTAALAILLILMALFLT